MDQPVAASKVSRTPRGGANRVQGNSTCNSNGVGAARTRKNGHALKFHNFVANDSWSAATHCLREEHGTKQITVSHWTPSQQQIPGSNNKNNLLVSHNSQVTAFDKQASQSKQQHNNKQQQQQQQSQHPLVQCRPVNVNQQHHRSWRKESNQQLFSSFNSSPSVAVTSPSGQPCVSQSSILESLLAKNILAQGHSTSQPCVRVRQSVDARRVQDATHPSLSPSSSSSSSSSSSLSSPSRGQQDSSHTQSNKEFTEGKVNRRKAFVVRRVLPSAALRLGQVEKCKNTRSEQSICTRSDLREKRTSTLTRDNSEQPLDLSTKKMSKQCTGQQPVIWQSSQSSRVPSMACDDQHSVEYLIRSVEQSAAQAASIIARVNGSYTKCASSSSSSSSSSCGVSASSSSLSPPAPAPATTSDYLHSSSASSSIPTHNSTVTSIANWVQMNKNKDNDMMMNNCTVGPKNTVRQKLEDAFRQNGFLVKTKQVSDGDATFCKFRQLRKYTRYYLKSWHKHLPDEVSQLYKVSYKNFKGFLPPNSDRR